MILNIELHTLLEQIESLELKSIRDIFILKM